MGHHIADMIILVMPHCRQHRQWILGYHRRHVIVIVAGEIKFGPSTAQYEDSIIVRSAVQDSIKGRHDGLRTRNALHLGREELRDEHEPVRVFMKMPHEIPVPSSIGSRNHGKPAGKKRKREPFLQIRKPFLHKAVHSAAPLQFPLSEGKVRVYVIYYKGQAVKLAVIDLDFNQDRHALRQRRAGDRLEIRSEKPVP